MARLGGPDEFVVLDAKQLPKLLIKAVYAIGQFLWGYALLLGRAFDVLPMLVRPAEQLHVETHHPLVAGDRVRNDGGVRATQVGCGIDVVERGSDVKGFGHKQLVYLKIPNRRVNCSEPSSTFIPSKANNINNFKSIERISLVASV